MIVEVPMKDAICYKHWLSGVKTKDCSAKTEAIRMYDIVAVEFGL